MKSQCVKIALAAITAVLLPELSHAQTLAGDMHSLQGLLDNLYNQMMPLCSGLMGTARLIAGFATLWYIGARVWKHLAAAEAVDVFPLLRPFVIGFCISIFPAVLGLVNGIMQPIVTATANMVTTSNNAVIRILDNQAQSASSPDETAGPISREPGKWYQYGHQTNSGSSLADQFAGWNWQDMVKKAIAELLNVLFEAAALCLDTIRTFKLIVLSILGPLCFALSIFEGFQHTLKQWLARYVNVFMWLPVANIFGAIIARIQENMIQLQQSGNLGGNALANSNTVYLVFLVIGIVGYFTVPGIANYIMSVGGHALFNRTTALASMAVTYAANAVFTSGSRFQVNQQTAAQTSNFSGDTYMRDRLSGGAGADAKSNSNNK